MAFAIGEIGYYSAAGLNERMNSQKVWISGSRINFIKYLNRNTLTSKMMKPPLAIFHPGYLTTLLGAQTVKRIMVQFEEVVLKDYGNHSDGAVFFLEFRAIHFDWLKWPPPFTLVDEDNLLLVMGASWRGRHLHLEQIGFYHQHSRSPREVQMAMNTYKNLITLDCHMEATQSV